MDANPNCSERTLTVLLGKQELLAASNVYIKQFLHHVVLEGVTCDVLKHHVLLIIFSVIE